jgi:hypothetical protein
VVLCNIDEHGHLGVVHNDHVRTAIRTSGERTTFLSPVTVGVLLTPVVEHLDLGGVEAGAGGVDALEDVVVVFGDAKNFGLGARNVPISVSKRVLMSCCISPSI